MRTTGTIFLSVFLLSSVVPAQYIPSGIPLQRTARKVEDLEWDRAKRGHDLLQLQSFVSRFPKSRHVREANKMIEALDMQEWRRSADETKPMTLVPTGKHTVRAVPAEKSSK